MPPRPLITIAAVLLGSPAWAQEALRLPDGQDERAWTDALELVDLSWAEAGDSSCIRIEEEPNGWSLTTATDTLEVPVPDNAVSRMRFALLAAALCRDGRVTVEQERLGKAPIEVQLGAAEVNLVKEVRERRHRKWPKGSRIATPGFTFTTGAAFRPGTEVRPQITLGWMPWRNEHGYVEVEVGGRFAQPLIGIGEVWPRTLTGMWGGIGGGWEPLPYLRVRSMIGVNRHDFFSQFTSIQTFSVPYVGGGLELVFGKVVRGGIRFDARAELVGAELVDELGISSRLNQLSGSISVVLSIAPRGRPERVDAGVTW